MAEFTSFTTQEQFDQMISARLERERDSIRKEYQDYDQIKASNTALQTQLEAANTKAKGFEDQITQLNGQIKGYKTESLKASAALAAGLPYEMRTRLSGETEEEIKKDAEALAKLMGGRQPAPPLADPEPTPPEDKDAALKRTLKNLNM